MLRLLRGRASCVKRLFEASVLTAGVAVCAYMSALYEPRLLGGEWIILVALYLTAPFCWLMPLTLRRAHLALWLALVLAKWTVGLFTLWGGGLILDVPATIAGKIFQAVLDVLFLLNGILAVQARSPNWQPLKGPHTLSIIAAPTVGTTIALLLWSTQNLSRNRESSSKAEPQRPVLSGG